MKKLIPFFFLLTAFSCTTTQPPIQAHQMRYTVEQYPPTTSCQVLHLKPADKPFTEIGEVSIKLSKKTSDNAVAYLREAAQKMGADAIILLGEKQVGSIAMPFAGSTVAIPIRKLYAVAIKYD